MAEDELRGDQSLKMKVCRKHFDHINECVDTLEEAISDLAKPYHKFIELATTIPVNHRKICYLHHRRNWGGYGGIQILKAVILLGGSHSSKRMMLTCLYHMFSKHEAFNPADTDYSAIPEEMYQNSTIRTHSNVWRKEALQSSLLLLQPDTLYL